MRKNRMLPKAIKSESLTPEDEWLFLWESYSS